MSGMTSRLLSTALPFLLAGLMLVPCARAQQVDVGAQVTHLDLGVLDQSTWGAGGRVGVELLPLVTVEAELNVFPQNEGVSGRIVQGLGGVKLGGRARTYGLFAKLRPGFVRFAGDFIQPGTACIAVVPTPLECLAARTNLALDFGTVVEIYPTSRAILRVDLGTTYVWYGSRGDARRRRYGNFQLGIGGGLRF